MDKILDVEYDDIGGESKDASNDGECWKVEEVVVDAPHRHAERKREEKDAHECQ